MSSCVLRVRLGAGLPGGGAWFPLGTGDGARSSLGAGVLAVAEQDDDRIGRREGERVQPRLAGVPTCWACRSLSDWAIFLM